MLKFLLLAGLIFVTVSLFKKNKAVKGDAPEPEKAVELAEDPICKTYVNRDTEFKVKYYDNIYYFCSQKCMDEFIEQKKTQGA